jgi:hypothetical protein
MKGYRTKPEYFHAKADECQRLVAELGLDRAKKDMLAVAKQWRELALQAERHGW